MIPEGELASERGELSQDRLPRPRRRPRPRSIALSATSGSRSVHQRPWTAQAAGRPCVTPPFLLQKKNDHKGLTCKNTVTFPSRSEGRESAVGLAGLQSRPRQSRTPLRAPQERIALWLCPAPEAGGLLPPRGPPAGGAAPAAWL